MSEREYSKLYAPCTDGVDAYRMTTHPCCECGQDFVISSKRLRRCQTTTAAAAAAAVRGNKALGCPAGILALSRRNTTHTVARDRLARFAYHVVMQSKASSNATGTEGSKEEGEEKSEEKKDDARPGNCKQGKNDDNNSSSSNSNNNNNHNGRAVCSRCRASKALIAKMHRAKARHKREVENNPFLSALNGSNPFAALHKTVPPTPRLPLDLADVSQLDAATLLPSLEQCVADVASSDLRTSVGVCRAGVSSGVMQRFAAKLHEKWMQARRQRTAAARRRPGAVYHATDNTVRLQLTFHGTSSANYDSIFRRGLVVPGSASGVPVRNGAVHGCGIYSSSSACTARFYARQTRSLLACLLIDDSSLRNPCRKVLNVNNIFVASDSAHICPLWIVSPPS